MLKTLRQRQKSSLGNKAQGGTKLNATHGYRIASSYFHVKRFHPKGEKIHLPRFTATFYTFPIGVMAILSRSSSRGGVHMKKTLMIAATAAFVMTGLLTTEANAGGFNVKKCKACHAVGKKKVGPSWKDVATAYGDEATLAAVFKGGFKVEDRKSIAANAKWKRKAGMMTGQYKKLIKGHEDEAAHELFEAVKRGKI
ncbi:MAG: hypothetical protein Q9M18_05395 [Mariprofundaceae bacterium]|nr:hypothetical protein [Mariprofundaceae bacterium]